MSWGRTLAKYDPEANATESWRLPDPSKVSIIPEDPRIDGNAVAFAIDGNNEIWLAANSLQALFGFDLSRHIWDRTLSLQFAPTDVTHIEVLRSGILTVNGVQTDRNPVMAVVNTQSGEAELVQARVTSYALIAPDIAVYVDERQSLAKIRLSSGEASVPLASGAPISGDPHLAIDGAGNAWFSMTAYKTVGIGKVNTASGAINVYPFPQVPVEGGGQLPCPNPPCDDSSVVYDPDIQSIVIDGRNNIWITTSVPGKGGDPHFTPPAAALYELPAGS